MGRFWGLLFVWVCLSSTAFGFATDICACVTQELAGGARQCALAPAHGQRAVLTVPLKAGAKCTQAICDKLYADHRAQASKDFFPLKCDQVVVDPDVITDVVSCQKNRPVLLNLSLTAEFDQSTSVNVPNPYQSLRFDANNCEIEKIGKSVGAYLKALKDKGCSCQGLVLNVNSHGDGEKPGPHQTLCREAVDGRQKNRYFSTRDFVLELHRQLKENKCEDAVTTVDSCYSSKVIKEFRNQELLFPVLTSAHEGCLAPGDSNLWTHFSKWCERCDLDKNAKLNLTELQQCLPKGSPTFQQLTYEDGKTRTISYLTGPWAMAHSQNLNKESTIFQCPIPTKPARYQGLQGRQRIEEENPTH